MHLQDILNIDGSCALVEIRILHLYVFRNVIRYDSNVCESQQRYRCDKVNLKTSGRQFFFVQTGGIIYYAFVLYALNQATFLSSQ